MEVIAVRASDGSIRTALNTCQVCYRSGRGYYKQNGGVLVCQNFGNRFQVDQVGLVKGGCNPIPVLEGEKSDLGDSILIPDAFLRSAAPCFAVWKKRAYGELEDLAAGRVTTKDAPPSGESSIRIPPPCALTIS